MKIAVIYPRISHYREEFFKVLNEHFDIDIYVYENDLTNNAEHFNISKITTFQLESIKIFSKYTLLNPLPFIKSNYKLIIMIGDLRVITIPLLLIFLKFTSIKSILWGHGISVHNYIQEEQKLNSLRVLLHRLADHIWLYTENEREIYKNYFPENKITSLNNTININNIINRPSSDKINLLAKYNIKTPINFIFCARFTLLDRRADLLKEIIQKLDPYKYGFIIIGDGPYKPEFSKHCNVLSMGSVYDECIKNELFDIADLYLQPAWIGLSANEALAYGKGILTFKRSENIKQCVEYSYLNDKNSYIAENVDDMIRFINQLTPEIISDLQRHALIYAKKNLTMESMTSSAINSIKSLVKN